MQLHTPSPFDHPKKIYRIFFGFSPFACAYRAVGKRRKVWTADAHVVLVHDT